MKILVDPEVSPRIVTILVDTTITVQNLVNDIRDWEQIPSSLSYPRLISAVGKQALGGTPPVYVGITVTLQNTKIKFKARDGPDYIQCFVSGGNLTAVDENGDPMSPIEPSAFTEVILAQSTSASIIEIGVSGLTSEESDQLMALPSAPENADAVWDEPKADHVGDGSAGKAIIDVETYAAFINRIEGGRWRIVNNQMIFYAADNVTEVARFNLFDSAGQPTQENVFERKRV